MDDFNALLGPMSTLLLSESSNASVSIALDTCSRQITTQLVILFKQLTEKGTDRHELGRDQVIVAAKASCMTMSIHVVVNR